MLEQSTSRTENSERMSEVVERVKNAVRDRTRPIERTVIPPETIRRIIDRMRELIKNHQQAQLEAEIEADIEENLENESEVVVDGAICKCTFGSYKDSSRLDIPFQEDRNLRIGRSSIAVEEDTKGCINSFGICKHLSNQSGKPTECEYFWVECPWVGVAENVTGRDGLPAVLEKSLTCCRHGGVISIVRSGQTRRNRIKDHAHLCLTDGSWDKFFYLTLRLQTRTRGESFRCHMPGLVYIDDQNIPLAGPYFNNPDEFWIRRGNLEHYQIQTGGGADTLIFRDSNTSSGPAGPPLRPGTMVNVLRIYNDVANYQWRFVRVGDIRGWIPPRNAEGARHDPVETSKAVVFSNAPVRHKLELYLGYHSSLPDEYFEEGSVASFGHASVGLRDGAIVDLYDYLNTKPLREERWVRITGSSAPECIELPSTYPPIVNGLIIHERVTQQPLSFGHNLPASRQLTQIDRITVHHPVADQMPSIATVNIWWSGRNWDRSGYHFLIRADGSIWQLVPIHTHSWGAYTPPNTNLRSIHISLAGSFTPTTVPSWAARNSFGFLCRLLLRHNQLPNLYDRVNHVVGHRTWRGNNPYDCPGFTREQYLSWI